MAKKEEKYMNKFSCKHTNFWGKKNTEENTKEK